MGNKVINISVGVLIAIAVLTELQTTIATATGTGGTFENTAAGSLLVLVPLVMVASILAFAYFNRKG